MVLCKELLKHKNYSLQIQKHVRQFKIKLPFNDATFVASLGERNVLPLSFSFYTISTQEQFEQCYI